MGSLEKPSYMSSVVKWQDFFTERGKKERKKEKEKRKSGKTMCDPYRRNDFIQLTYGILEFGFLWLRICAQYEFPKVEKFRPMHP